MSLTNRVRGRERQKVIPDISWIRALELHVDRTAWGRRYIPTQRVSNGEVGFRLLLVLDELTVGSMKQSELDAQQ